MTQEEAGLDLDAITVHTVHGMRPHTGCRCNCARDADATAQCTRTQVRFSCRSKCARDADAIAHGMQRQLCTHDADAAHGMQMQLRTGCIGNCVCMGCRCYCAQGADATAHGMQMQLRMVHGCNCAWDADAIAHARNAGASARGMQR